MTWANASGGATETWDNDIEATFVDGFWDDVRYWNDDDIWRDDPIWAQDVPSVETWTGA